MCGRPSMLSFWKTNLFTEVFSLCKTVWHLLRKPWTVCADSVIYFDACVTAEPAQVKQSWIFTSILNWGKIWCQALLHIFFCCFVHPLNCSLDMSLYWHLCALLTLINSFSGSGPYFRIVLRSSCGFVFDQAVHFWPAFSSRRRTFCYELGGDILLCSRSDLKNINST